MRRSGPAGQRLVGVADGLLWRDGAPREGSESGPALTTAPASRLEAAPGRRDFAHCSARIHSRRSKA